MKNLKLIQVFSEVTGRFLQKGIEVMPLKGITYLYRFYEDPSRRPMLDIDLLVREEDIPRIHQVMEELGARQRTGMHSDFLDSLMHHLPPMTYKGAMIEFHTRFFRKTSSFSLSAESAWRESQEAELFNQKVRILKPECHLVYITLHAWNHMVKGRFKLIWLADVIRYLQKTEIDWKHVLPLLQNEADRRAFYGMMGLAERLEQVTLPREIQNNLKEEWTDEAGEALENHLEDVPFDSTRAVFRSIEKLKGKERLRYMRDIVFPSRAFLRKKYKGPFVLLYPYHAVSKVLEGIGYLFRRMRECVNARMRK